MAFTVAHGDSKTYSPGERIEFGTVITNEGGGFLPGQNEFLCPWKGLYMFSLSSAGYGTGGSAITELWMDENLLVTSLAVGSTNSATSNTVFAQCDSGSRVYVQCTSQASCAIFGNQNGYDNTVTFSGMLLAEDVAYQTFKCLLSCNILLHWNNYVLQLGIVLYSENIKL